MFFEKGSPFRHQPFQILTTKKNKMSHSKNAKTSDARRSKSLLLFALQASWTGNLQDLQMWCLSTKCILILYKPVFSPKETYGLVPACQESSYWTCSTSLVMITCKIYRLSRRLISHQGGVSSMCLLSHREVEGVSQAFGRTVSVSM